tara:strand:+ start:2154 stop:2483 length:330 start_codon:yes stop_codon:yes gene_type:complete
MPAICSEVGSSGISENDLTKEVLALQSESLLRQQVDANGQPQNSATWSAIIERHLYEKSDGHNDNVLELRRQRLRLLTDTADWRYSTRIKTVNKKLFKATKNLIYDLDR